MLLPAENYLSEFAIRFIVLGDPATGSQVFRARQLPAEKSLSDIFWLLGKSWAESRVRAMELTAEVGRAKC